MKRRALVVMSLCLSLLCGCALIAGRQVSGRWEGTAAFELSPVGPKPREIVLVIAETDDSITGTLEWFDTYDNVYVADVTGTRTGSHIEITGIVHGLPLILEGALHRRTIAGTCTYRGSADTWQVVRVG
jgi:small nuclear ribonucleoprotein (snRNP)-like protein